ncbi:MAG: flagellar export protein FliJ [Nitrospirae bacterium]|nr:flagellar export protein FliJ [Nitrospirota bacterium]
MPFRFRLQKVLEVRERIEENRRKELRTAMELYQAELQRLTALRRKHEEVQADFDERMRTGFVPYEGVIYQNYFRRSRQEIADQNGRIAKSKLNVDEKRKAYIQSRKEKQVIERFKERRFEEYRVEEERSQNKLLNELGVIAFNRPEESAQ